MHWTDLTSSNLGLCFFYFSPHFLYHVTCTKRYVEEGSKNYTCAKVKIIVYAQRTQKIPPGWCSHYQINKKLFWIHLGNARWCNAYLTHCKDMQQYIYEDKLKGYIGPMQCMYKCLVSERYEIDCKTNSLWVWSIVPKAGIRQGQK